MKKRSIAGIIALAGLMTGCAASSQMTLNQNIAQTNVELSQKNYRVVGTVEGQASITRVLGIGGISKKAIKANSHAEMVKNANLKGSQALINVTTEIKMRGFIPFYTKNVYTTHGQIIEFTE